MSEVDPGSRRPLYRQVRDILSKRWIESASPGHPLPTENELAEQLGVSRMVVHRAMRELCREGYLTRRPRLGTFVAQRPTTLRVAYYELSSDAHSLYSIEHIVSLFTKAHPDISVELIDLPDLRTYPDRVRGLLATGEVDVVKFSEAVFRAIDAERLLRPLNVHARQDRAATYAEPWEAFKRKNTIFGYPVAFSPVVIAYNRALFDEAGVDIPHAGWTWRHLLDKAKRLTLIRPAGNSPDNIYGFSCPFHINYWPVFVLQNAGTLITDDSESFNLEDPRVREGILYLRDLCHKWKVAPLMRGSQGDVLELFAHSRLAMATCSYYGLSELNRITDFGWGLAPLPRNRTSATILLADGFGVAKKTTQLAAARKFLSFLVSPPVQTHIRASRTLVPVHRDIAHTPREDDPHHYAVYRDQLRCARLLGVPYAAPSTRMLAEEMELFWFGLRDYEQTCQRIRRRHAAGDRGATEEARGPESPRTVSVRPA